MSPLLLKLYKKDVTVVELMVFHTPVPQDSVPSMDDWKEDSHTPLSYSLSYLRLFPDFVVRYRLRTKERWIYRMGVMNDA